MKKRIVSFKGSFFDVKKNNISKILTSIEMIRKLPHKAIISCSVWGDWHSDIFAKIGIPNINSLLEEIPIPYEIKVYTDSKSIQKFEKLNAKFITIFDNNDKVKERNNAINQTVEQSVKEDAVILWWIPDQYYSKGVWKTVFEKISNGYKMVMQPSIRLTDELVPLLGSVLNPETPRALASLIPTYLHQMQRACDWNTFDKEPQTKFCHQPCLYLDCGYDEGFVIKGFQGYIIASNPTKYHLCELGHGVDGGLVEHVIDNVEQIYVLQDSDEGLCVDFSPKHRFHPHINTGITKDDKLKYWASLHLNKAHLHMLMKTMIVHTGKITQKLLDAKERLEKETHHIIQPILELKLKKADYKRGITNNIVKESNNSRIYVGFIVTETHLDTFYNKTLKDLGIALKKYRGKDIRIIIYCQPEFRGRLKHQAAQYEVNQTYFREFTYDFPKYVKEMEEEASQTKNTLIILKPDDMIEQNYFDRFYETTNH